MQPHILPGRAHTRYEVKIPGSGRFWQVALGIGGAVLLLALLLAGDKSLVALLERYQERNRLAQQIIDYQRGNLKFRQQIQALHAQPKAVEPIAREELGLVRPGEMLYRFVPTPESGDGR